MRHAVPPLGATASGPTPSPCSAPTAAPDAPAAVSRGALAADAAVWATAGAMGGACSEGTPKAAAQEFSCCRVASWGPTGIQVKRTRALMDAA